MLLAGKSRVRFPIKLSDFFNLPNSSRRIMALGSTQPLTEISTRKFPGGTGSRRVGLATLPPSVSLMSEYVGTSTSRNPKGLHGLHSDDFTLLLCNHSVHFRSWSSRPLFRKVSKVVPVLH
jgi:hypothetical protein